MKLYSQHIFPHLEAVATSGLKAKRKRLLSSAMGNVLEIGTGAGQNYPYINSNITSYTAIEPSPTFISMASKNKRKLNHNVNIDIIQGKAENLPFRPFSFDTVICFLVLCTVGNVTESIKQIKKVLKPGGKLLLFEHVLAKDESIAKWQNFLNPMWRHIGCGCNLTRDTLNSINIEGFNSENVSYHKSSGMGFPITSQVIEGIASK